MQRRPRFLGHRDATGVGIGSIEFRLRSRDVRDRVHTDRFGDDAAPASLERPHDVAVGLRRRGGGEQVRVPELQAGKRHRQVGSHGVSLIEARILHPGRVPGAECVCYVPALSMRTLKNYIDGQWRGSSSGKCVKDLNPADTNEVLAEAPSSTAAEAAEACDAALRAFPGWRSTPAPARGKILYKVQRRLEERHQEI